MKNEKIPLVIKNVVGFKITSKSICNQGTAAFLNSQAMSSELYFLEVSTKMIGLRSELAILWLNSSCFSFSG